MSDEQEGPTPEQWDIPVKKLLDELTDNGFKALIVVGLRENGYRVGVVRLPDMPEELEEGVNYGSDYWDIWGELTESCRQALEKATRRAVDMWEARIVAEQKEKTDE